MKKLVLATALVMIAKFSFAQTKPTREHVKELLDVTGFTKITTQMLDQMITSYKTNMPDVPGEFWDAMKTEMKIDDLIELVIPIYSKHYSDEEVMQLVAFYKTPLGKKVTEKLPLITQESYAAGEEWGRKIGEKIIKKLTEKGYNKQ